MGLFDLFTRKKRNDMYLYTEEQLEQYEEFITEQFGEFTEVFHEIVSENIHLDIIVIPPTEECNYYKLITMGMGAYPMNIPRELRKYELERAELVLYLPPTWNIKSKKEEDFWPIRAMKILGRLPIEHNTWLGFGHTVSSDADDTPYALNTELCSMMLLTALSSQFEELDLKIEGLGRINFYQMFPLYKEELALKQEQDAESLLDLFDDDDIMPIINIKRRNYGKGSCR